MQIDFMHMAYAIQLKGLLFFQPEPLFWKSVQKPKTQQRSIEARKHICISFDSIISQYIFAMPIINSHKFVEWAKSIRKFSKSIQNEFESEALRKIEKQNGATHADKWKTFVTTIK